MDKNVSSVPPYVKSDLAIKTDYTNNNITQTLADVQDLVDRISVNKLKNQKSHQTMSTTRNSLNSFLSSIDSDSSGSAASSTYDFGDITHIPYDDNHTSNGLFDGDSQNSSFRSNQGDDLKYQSPLCSTTALHNKSLAHIFSYSKIYRNASSSCENMDNYINTKVFETDSNQTMNYYEFKNRLNKMKKDNGGEMNEPKQPTFKKTNPHKTIETNGLSYSNIFHDLSVPSFHQSNERAHRMKSKTGVSNLTKKDSVSHINTHTFDIDAEEFIEAKSEVSSESPESDTRNSSPTKRTIDISTQTTASLYGSFGISPKSNQNNVPNLSNNFESRTDGGTTSDCSQLKSNYESMILSGGGGVTDNNVTTAAENIYDEKNKKISLVTTDLDTKKDNKMKSVGFASNVDHSMNSGSGLERSSTQDLDSSKNYVYENGLFKRDKFEDVAQSNDPIRASIEREISTRFISSEMERQPSRRFMPEKQVSTRNLKGSMKKQQSRRYSGGLTMDPQSIRNDEEKNGADDSHVKVLRLSDLDTDYRSPHPKHLSKSPYSKTPPRNKVPGIDKTPRAHFRSPRPNETEEVNHFVVERQSTEEDYDDEMENIDPIEEVMNICLNTGDVHRLRRIFDYGHEIDVDATLEVGWSPVHLCCTNGFTDCLIELVHYRNAKPNLAYNAEGFTPLHSACRAGNLLVVMTLMYCLSKDDINRPSKDGSTPLHFACANGFRDIVEHLLKNDADINVVNEEGHTPFFFAAWENHVEIVNYLLINDHVYVNVTDANGYNALHVACSTKNVKLTQVLLTNGIDVQMRNKSGQKPIDLLNFKSDSRNEKMIYDMIRTHVKNPVHFDFDRILVSEPATPASVDAKKKSKPFHEDDDYDDEEEDHEDGGCHLDIRNHFSSFSSETSDKMGDEKDRHHSPSRVHENTALGTNQIGKLSTLAAIRKSISNLVRITKPTNASQQKDLKPNRDVSSKEAFFPNTSSKPSTMLYSKYAENGRQGLDMSESSSPNPSYHSSPVTSPTHRTIAKTPNPSVNTSGKSSGKGLLGMLGVSKKESEQHRKSESSTYTPQQVQQLPRSTSTRIRADSTQNKKTSSKPRRFSFLSS